MVEQFPARIRVSGIALSYNTAFALFGGTAPLVATFLIKETGSKAAPSFYLMFSAAVSWLVFLRLRGTYEDRDPRFGLRGSRRRIPNPEPRSF